MGIYAHTFQTALEGDIERVGNECPPYKLN